MSADKRGVRGIQNIVDEACRLNANIKASNVKLDELKDKIKEHARTTKRRGIKGKTGWAVVSDRSSSTMDNMAVWRALGKKISKFVVVVSVTQGKLAEFLDSDKIKKLKVVTPNPYSVIHLKPKGDDDGEGMDRLLRKLDS